VSDLPDGLTLEHHTAAEARELRATVEDIYRRSYVDAIASGHLFDSPTEFMTRFDAYTSPARSSGFAYILARIGDVPVGQIWGWPVVSGSRTWEGLHLETGEDAAAFTAEDGTRTFALSEIMVCAEHAGRGIARALHDELLRSRPERRGTLLVEADNERAYGRYLQWGWRKVGWLRPNWPDAPRFDVLIRDLR
jgi:ribosomal protein S18 acetylase RimI-like enzyme